MLIAGKKRCIYCLHPLNENETCDVCHGKQSDYKPLPNTLRPGTCLRERYFIGRVLGVGGFGITYMAWDIILAVPVAVKEYCYRGEEETEFQKGMKNFLQEARCLSRVPVHSGIVAVKDYFQENETAYIVMEYVDGSSIKKYVQKNGKMDATVAIRIMEPVIDSLRSMHDIKLLHRDISPDNIMLTKEGKVYLIDFGTARLFDNTSKTMTMSVKRGFSPEEQYRQKGEQGPWSDVYSLCSTMYYMLTGDVPDESVERVLSDKVVPLKHRDEVNLPEEIKAAIDKGMSVFAKDRYEDAAALYKALYPNRDILVLQTEEGKKAKVQVEENDQLSKTFIKRELERLLGGKRKPYGKIAILSLAIIVMVAVGAVVWSGKESGGEVPTLTMMPNSPSGTEKHNSTPGATSNSKATKKPTATPKPKVTKKPITTPKSKATKKPTATPKPKVTKKPKATPKPVVTKKPKATSKPKAKKKEKDKNIPVIDDFLT